MTLRLWDVKTGCCIHAFEGHAGSVTSVDISPDGRWALSGSVDKTLRLWELVWDYEFPERADWDDGARSHLINFLTLHTPYAAHLRGDEELTEEQTQQTLTRRGKPTWTAADFKQLLNTLVYAGFGNLRPEGIKQELEKMAAVWTGPPTLFHEEIN